MIFLLPFSSFKLLPFRTDEAGQIFFGVWVLVWGLGRSPSGIFFGDKNETADAVLLLSGSVLAGTISQSADGAGSIGFKQTSWLII